MKIKKLLIGVVLLLSLILSACSSGDKAESGESGEKSEGKNEKVTINYFTWESGEAAAAIEEKIKNFENENPNIDVNYKALVTNNDTVEYYKKLDIQTGTGQPIDVVAFSHVDFLTERAARGVLAPLDEYFGTDNVNPEEEFFINPTFDGKTYGVQDLSQPWLVAINKDALDKAGLQVPEWGWTWDDFRDYAKKLTTEDQYGAYFHTWGEYAGFPGYSEMPHPYLTKDEKPAFDNESFKNYFNLRRQMEEEGSVKSFQDTIAAKLHYATEYFNGEAAMVPTGSFFLVQIMDEEKYPHDFKTVFAPLPRSSEDVEIGSTYTGGHYLGVGESSKHKEEANKLALYMAQQTDVVTDFPGSRNVDKEKVIDHIVGDYENLIDRDSLVNTVYDERAYIPYDPTYSTGYSSQLKKILEDGFSKFMLDGISAEEAQQIMVEQTNKIIEQNK